VNRRIFGKHGKTADLSYASLYIIETLTSGHWRVFALVSSFYLFYMFVVIVLLS